MDDFDFAVSVFSDYDEDGHLVIQHDAPGVDEKAGVAPSECVLPWGLLARPLDPEKDANATPTEGCGLLTWMHGDRRYHTPIGDPRATAKLPKARKGGAGLYGGAGDYLSFLLFDGLDPTGVATPGSLNVSTPYAKSGAKKSHYFGMLIREPGQEAIVLMHGEGHGFMCTTTGKRAALMKNAAGNASVMVSDDGVAINGKTKLVGSLTVGEQMAARPVVLGPELVALLTQLIGIVAAITAVTPGAPAAALIPQLQAIMSKQFKTT